MGAFLGMQVELEFGGKTILSIDAAPQLHSPRPSLPPSLLLLRLPLPAREHLLQRSVHALQLRVLIFCWTRGLVVLLENAAMLIHNRYPFLLAGLVELAQPSMVVLL